MYFVRGHDLKEITAARENDDSGEAYFKNLFDSCSLLMQLIVNTPKPFIAEVDGVATAAGCQLVASCDLAIASHESKFATPGVNIGLFVQPQWLLFLEMLIRKTLWRCCLLVILLMLKRQKK